MILQFRKLGFTCGAYQKVSIQLDIFTVGDVLLHQVDAVPDHMHEVLVVQIVALGATKITLHQSFFKADQPLFVQL
jgi:hypothetical protein